MARTSRPRRERLPAKAGKVRGAQGGAKRHRPDNLDQPASVVAVLQLPAPITVARQAFICPACGDLVAVGADISKIAPAPDDPAGTQPVDACLACARSALEPIRTYDAPAVPHDHRRRPPNSTHCSTCDTPAAPGHRLILNRRGRTVHAGGCPRRHT